MSISWFTWKGVNNNDMGVILRSYPDYTKPKERFSTVTIPGRSGSLTVLEDYDAPVYDEYNISLDMYTRPNVPMRSVLEWLRGQGQLVLGNDPDMAIYGRIDNNYTVSQIVKGRQYYEMSVNVRCQPYKHRRVKTIISTKTGYSGGTNGGTLVEVNNPGSAPSFPIIEVCPDDYDDASSISISTLKVEIGYLDSSDNFVAAYGTCQFSSVNSVGLYYDAETGVPVSYDKSQSAPGVLSITKGSEYDGTAQMIPVGKSVIRISSASSTEYPIRINPNWRYI